MYDLLAPSEILEEELNLRIEAEFNNPSGYSLGFKLQQHLDSSGKPVNRYRVIGVPMYSDGTIIKDFFAIPIQMLEAYVILFNRIKAWKEEGASLELVSKSIPGVKEVKVWSV